MSTRNPGKRKEIDPFEKAIEAALSPGTFISYRSAWSFLDDLQNVADDIGKIIKEQPKRAARLCEIFIGACHEKADEIDDSSGDFGILVNDLFRAWIKARQAANEDPGETSRTLLAWMEGDPYGFCHDLDREAVKVLDKKGLKAFAQQIRSKLESSPTQGDEEKHFAGYACRRWGGVLKTLLAAQRNVNAYILLCDQTELEVSDCMAIAKMLKSRRRPEDALSWVERGLKIARTNSETSHETYQLRALKRALLAKLGRSEDALQSAWSEFESQPSSFTYKELMRYVPAKEKTAWREQAMKAADKGDLSSLIELWLEYREYDRLVSRLRRTTDKELEDLSHYWTEPLARKLEHSHPDIAARVYRALCIRIVNAGLDTDWQVVIADVRDRHFRKKGFMAVFEDIVAGAPKYVDPPFLERARSRWPRE